MVKITSKLKFMWVKILVEQVKVILKEKKIEKY